MCVWLLLYPTVSRTTVFKRGILLFGKKYILNSSLVHNSGSGLQATGTLRTFKYSNTRSIPEVEKKELEVKFHFFCHITTMDSQCKGTSEEKAPESKARSGAPCRIQFVWNVKTKRFSAHECYFQEAVFESCSVVFVAFRVVDL